MRKKSVSIISVGICTAVILCACSSGEDENVFTGETTEKLPYQENLDAISPAAYSEAEGLDLEPGTYISVIGKEENASYWKQIREGVEQAGEDLNEALGYTGEDQIRVLFNAPADGEDIDEQVNILDEELARYPDVVAIASIDESASAVQFDLATENGIPIVAFDSGNSYKGIQCTCRTDNTKAAAEGAAHLCEAVENSGEVALIVQDSVSENGKEREAGFREEITSGHPNVTIVETIYMDQLDGLKRQAAAEQLNVTLETEEETSDQESQTAVDPEAENKDAEEDSAADEKMEEVTAAAEAMSDEEAVAYYLGKHPELKGCFGTNEAATQLCVSALASMDRIEDVTVMGFDAGKEQLDSLENGDVDGLIVQNPFGIGYASVIAAARTVLEIGNEADVNTGYIWADRDNMEEETVQAMLYE